MTWDIVISLRTSSITRRSATSLGSIFYGMIDRRPAVIVSCTGVSDVVASIQFARRYGLVVSVRGGGHNVSGNAVTDGGLMIDLSPMRAVRVDPTARTVRAEPGVLLGELDQETQKLGLVVPAGIVSHTGLAGLTLGGGFGWLSRKFGLNIDHLLSVDVVTADAQLVTADAEHHADLFWGIRGGGGNFEIVTSFEFSLEHLGPTVLAGFVYYPAEEAHDVLRRYRDCADQAPEEVTTIVSLRWALAAPFLSEDLHGKKVAAVGACYFAAIEPFSTGGVYVNFLGEEGEKRVRAAYGEQKYERLAVLKRKYDPSNVFRLNQNITPGAA